jgi:hypothetical protein
MGRNYHPITMEAIWRIRSLSSDRMTLYATGICRFKSRSTLLRAKIDLTDNSVGAWIIKHVETMFSERERRLLRANPQVNVPGITLFKKSLYDFVNMTCNVMSSNRTSTTPSR